MDPLLLLLRLLFPILLPLLHLLFVSPPSMVLVSAVYTANDLVPFTTEAASAPLSIAGDVVYEVNCF